jgi:acetylornithine/succinyldiaminopimelate/putrescine aminotransferase
VEIDVGPECADAIERMKQHGVLVSTTVHPTVVRAVAHLDVSDAEIETAIAAISAALTRTTAPVAR